MRYFRRDGTNCVVRDGDGLERFVPGPDFESGEPGGRLAYDDSTPAGEKNANQYATMPGWHEEDASGNPVPRPEKVVPEPEEEVEPKELLAPAATRTTDIDRKAPDALSSDPPGEGAQADDHHEEGI